VPFGPSRRRYSSNVEGRGDRADALDAFGLEGAKYWQELAGMLVGGRVCCRTPDVPLAFRTANAALVRSEMSRRSFSAKAA